MCRCTLLPYCYTQMGDSGTLVCYHHLADSQVTKLSASAEAADMERKDGEETSAEGADSAAGGQRSGHPSGSPDPLAPAVADAAVGEAESCGPAPGPSEAAMQQEVAQEKIGESGPTPGCKSSPPSIPVLSPATSLAAGERTPSYFAVGYLFLCVNI